MPQSSATLKVDHAAKRRRWLEDQRLARRQFMAAKYGFREREVMAVIRIMRDGGKSYKTIANALNSRGLKSGRGAKFYPMTVKRLADEEETLRS